MKNNPCKNDDDIALNWGKIVSIEFCVQYWNILILPIIYKI